MVQSSDKIWSTGEGNGKTLLYSCLKNPINSMKTQKNIAQEDEPPRSVGVQIASKKEQRNSSRKKRLSQSRNAQLWMYLVVKVKSNVVQNNIAQKPERLDP